MEIARPVARAASAPRAAVPKTPDLWQNLKYSIIELRNMRTYKAFIGIKAITQRQALTIITAPRNCRSRVLKGVYIQGENFTAPVRRSGRRRSETDTKVDRIVAQ